MCLCQYKKAVLIVDILQGFNVNEGDFGFEKIPKISKKLKSIWNKAPEKEKYVMRQGILNLSYSL